jgi:hypothetical protein
MSHEGQFGDDANYGAGYRSVLALLKTHRSFLREWSAEKILALRGFREEIIGKSDQSDELEESDE